MSQDDLRVLLENGGNGHHRYPLFHGAESLEHVAAHVELDLVGDHQCPVVDLRPARNDLDVKPAGSIGAVGYRLVEPAMFRLSKPVGSEGDLLHGK